MDPSGTEFSVMNIDEFLNENNFDFGRFSPPVAEDERGQREDTPSISTDGYRYELSDRMRMISLEISK